MYNVNPFELIISEPFVKLDGEEIHKVIGFHIETGEELVLFNGTWGECKEFVSSVECNAMVKLRHYDKLMDRIAELTSEVADVRGELREQEYAYDCLLVDYNDLDHKYQAEVAKNDDRLGNNGKVDRKFLFRIATGKTSRSDAVRFLVEFFNVSYDKAYQYINLVLAKD